MGGVYIFIFNLTATLLFLDTLVQTIWPPALFRLFKRREERGREKGSGKKGVDSSCLRLFSLRKPRRTKAG